MVNIEKAKSMKKTTMAASLAASVLLAGGAGIAALLLTLLSNSRGGSGKGGRGGGGPFIGGGGLGGGLGGGFGGGRSGGFGGGGGGFTLAQQLTRQVADSEQRHTGQVRICVEAGLPAAYIWGGANARERAVSLFGKLGVWDTEENNGVLIYLLLADRAIEIVADRGLARQIPAGTWDTAVHCVLAPTTLR